ncbi:hypothetical protein COP2_009698 [Malus domestica]
MVTGEISKAEASDGDEGEGSNMEGNINCNLKLLDLNEIATIEDGERDLKDVIESQLGILPTNREGEYGAAILSKAMIPLPANHDEDRMISAKESNGGSHSAGNNSEHPLIPNLFGVPWVNVSKNMGILVNHSLPIEGVLNASKHVLIGTERVNGPVNTPPQIVGQHLGGLTFFRLGLTLRGEGQVENDMPNPDIP